MRMTILAALLALISATAHACTPTESDFNALAQSPSQLTAEKFSALAPEKQKAVCDTRAFVQLVDSRHGVINKIGGYSPKYLTPDENSRVIAASNSYLKRLLASKGLGKAT